MKRTPVLIVLATAWCPQGVIAQSSADPPPTVILLRPAAEPVPALKYRLVPERRSLVPGNAAIFYHRAMELLLETYWQAANRQFKKESTTRSDPFDDEIARWLNEPIADIPREEARRQIQRFWGALNEIELGARCLGCDWQFDNRKEGISLLIPEIQHIRTLGRLAALRARLAILDGKTDEAVHWIEIGFAMGRHVSQGPIVIQALVGVAIDMLTAQTLEALIQAPGTPSLFWALADRPRPFIDMRCSMEGERYLLERSLPALAELDRGPWSLDQARRFTDDLQEKVFVWNGGERFPGTTFTVPSHQPIPVRRLGIAAMAAKIYPEARRALIAQGRSEAEVEAMPVVQVAALYSLQQYRKMSDDAYKWVNIPYWRSQQVIDRERMTVEEKRANPLVALLRILMPSLNSCRIAALRLDRRLDALQCIEAVRLYAEGHGGKLPDRLEAVTEAPVPIDVLTGKPFTYQVEGDTATLSAPPPSGYSHPSFRIHYVLKLAP
jgi:hypothetical protein